MLVGAFLQSREFVWGEACYQRETYIICLYMFYNSSKTTFLNPPGRAGQHFSIFINMVKLWLRSAADVYCAIGYWPVMEWEDGARTIF